ncbi:MAG: hypothetical protein MI784_07590 [Cytophagales bacterium]|nr:hypothetical protein [Cytophagales bacterium]
MTQRFCLCFFLLLCAGAELSFAQRIENQFGQNRQQFNSKDWRFFSSRNFDVYFYGKNDGIAREGIEYLEGHFEKLTDFIGYAPYTKIQVFLYNSEAQKLESNVGLNNNMFTINGQTEFVKSHIEVSYPGSKAEFKKALLYKVSQLLVEDMMSGGSLVDLFQSTYLVRIPDWFILGAARFLAFRWDQDMDDYIRAIVGRKKRINLNKFEGEEAAVIGQSIWNYINQRYGKATVSNILNLTRIIHDEDKAISNSLGISYDQLMNDWKDYYLTQRANSLKHYRLPSDKEILDTNEKSATFNNVVFSPGERYLAYSENFNGKVSVKILDLETKKKKTILKLGNKLTSQIADPSLPLISWKNDSLVGVINAQYGRFYLWLYDLKTKSKLKRKIPRLQEINSFDLHKGKAKLALLSGSENGVTNIYALSLRRFTVRKLTNDPYDNLNPVFLPSQNSFVFSSNRTSDSLRVRTGFHLDKQVNQNFNLYLFSFDSSRKVVYRLTNTLDKDIAPQAINEHSFLYLANQQGIFNIFSYDLNNRSSIQVSNYLVDINNYSFAPKKSLLAYTLQGPKRQHIYLSKLDPSQNNFTPPTTRVQLINAKRVAQKLRERRKKIQSDSLRMLKQKMDSLNALAALEAKKDSLQALPPEIGIKESEHIAIDSLLFETPGSEKKDEPVDTENYQFKPEYLKAQKKRMSYLVAYRKKQENSSIQGPLPYKPLFRADNLATSFVIDPLFDFAIRFDFQMNDLLEDHRFLGQLTTTTDFRNNLIVGEYQYYKHLIDFKVKYIRRFHKIDFEPSRGFENFNKYVLDQIILGASLPLSPFARVEVNPFYAATTFRNLDYTKPQDINRIRNYIGSEFSLVYDNSIASAFNAYKGVKVKASMEYFYSTDKVYDSFGKIYLDARKYLPLIKDITLAGRLFYGRFFGPSPKKFLLGGVDNWIFNESVPEQVEGLDEGLEDEDLLFKDYVTGLRGFDYNTFNGENAILASVELRIPVFRMLTHKPITSNFIRNFHIVGFFDTGSSWTGNQLWPTENNINYQLRDSKGNFDIIIKNFNSPFLASFGTGIRTSIFGYYVKADWAWPVKTYKVEDPRFFLSLGFDF